MHFLSLFITFIGEETEQPNTKKEQRTAKYSEYKVDRQNSLVVVLLILVSGIGRESALCL